MDQEEAEQLVAQLPVAGSRSTDGNARPWWLVEQVLAVPGPDRQWLLELRWSQNGFRRGARQRDLVSIVTRDRLVGVDEMASHIRHLLIEEPHGTAGTAAADGRVWWDSAEGGEPTADWSTRSIGSGPVNTSEVVAGWITRPGNPGVRWPEPGPVTGPEERST